MLQTFVFQFSVEKPNVFMSFLKKKFARELMSGWPLLFQRLNKFYRLIKFIVIMASKSQSENGFQQIAHVGFVELTLSIGVSFKVLQSF